MPETGPALSPGMRLGAYRILTPIGAGGMGEVYRAFDGKLDREVAVKVLPASMAGDPSRVARFEREAKALAALNHPNILAIHDFGNEGGVVYSVTELLEGQTLRERLASGAMDVDLSLRLAREIAEGLAAAHERGIIHRDLKPGNVFISKDEHVKILDFGLARLEVPEAAGDGPFSESPTAENPTRPGTVLGTVGYMSPEQARGQPVDQRTDIFSLGVIVFEMLSGKGPFQGRSDADTLAALLTRQPPQLLHVGQSVPAAVEAFVRRCLEKAPSARFQTAREAALALSAMAGSRSSVRDLEPPARPGAVGWVTGAAGLLVIAALAVLWFRARAGSDRLPGFEPRQITSRPGYEGQPALSPDGNTVAYTVESEGRSDIWVTDARGGSPLRLTTGPGPSSSPAWFPDGSALAYVSRRNGVPAIYKVPRLGGSPMLLVPNALDPAVSPDGTRIAFARADGGGFRRIWTAPLAEGGKAGKLTGDADGTWDHDHPAWSPDGRTICYQDQNDIWAIPADGGPSRRLTHDDNADADPAWSPDGRYVYFDSLRDGPWAIWRIGVKGGAPVRVTLGTSLERHPSLSRDGRQMAYATSGKISCTLVDTSTGRRTLLPTGSLASEPAFAPDGGSLVFASDRQGGDNLWKITLKDGQPSGEPERLTEQRGNCSNLAFSPDGKWIAYHRVVDRQRDVWVMPSDGGAPVNFTDNPAMDAQPRWSPDGRRIAFVSDRGGSIQVWTAPFQDGRRSGEPFQVTHAQGDCSNACWSRDGSRIAYILSDSTGADVWETSADGGGSPVRLTRGAQAGWLAPDYAAGGLLAIGTWGGQRNTVRLVGFSGGESAPVAQAAPTRSDASLMEVEASRDGTLLVLVEEEQEGDVWMLEARKGHF